jgi:hypothetical protein
LLSLRQQQALLSRAGQVRPINASSPARFVLERHAWGTAIATRQLSIIGWCVRSRPHIDDRARQAIAMAIQAIVAARGLDPRNWRDHIEVFDWVLDKIQEVRDADFSE